MRQTLRERLSYRPVVDELEDRTAPAVLRFTPPPPPPPATHLEVIVPAHVETGKAFEVIVRAEDAKDRVVPGFRGTVQFSLGITDTGATLPGNYTFTAKDQGVRKFQVKLTSTVTQNVKANTNRLAGQGAVIVDPAVTHFRVDAFSKANVGMPTMVNVTALDANNNVVPGYTGKVHFSSTDIYAELPKDYKFTAGDAGTQLFAVTYWTAGTHTLGVREVGGSPTGMAQTKVLWPWSTYNPNYTGMPSGLNVWGYYTTPVNNVIFLNPWY
ncbi:MAG: hypothetical protein FJ303_07870 [Planctomycetes bacterium]|nr:hypothetical protein [Planctomycetota bacterium]